MKVFLALHPDDPPAIAAPVTEQLTERGGAVWTAAEAGDDFSGEIAQSDALVLLLTEKFRADVETPELIRAQLFRATAPDVRCPVYVVQLSPDAQRFAKIASRPSFTLYGDSAHIAAEADRLADHIRQKRRAKPARSPRDLEKAYLDRAADDFESFDFSQFTDLKKTSAPKKANLTQELRPVYSGRGSRVQAQIARHAPQRSGALFSPNDDAPQDRLTTSESLLDALLESPRVALVGDPGCGKTTTLRMMARRLAAAAANTEENAVLPMLVPLGGFTGGDLDSYLAERLTGLPYQDYKEAGRLVFLLDGLNETAHVDRVAEWLSQNPTVRVVVSCRKIEYNERQLDLQRFDVLPLDVEQLIAFLRNHGLSDDALYNLFWSLAGESAAAVFDNARNIADQENPAALPDENALFRDFWQTADSPLERFPARLRDLQDDDRAAYERLWLAYRDQNKLPGALELARNPYLLRLTIEIFNRQQAAPRSQGELFALYVEKMIDERGRRAVRPDRPWIAPDVQIDALRQVAAWMQYDGKTQASEADIETVLVRHTQDDTTARHLLDFAFSAGLFERISGEVRFSHQLLQQYFAAYELARAMRDNQTADQFWADDQWWMATAWNESAVLLAGMTNAVPKRTTIPDAWAVIGWLRAVNPIVAWRCIEENDLSIEHAYAEALMEPNGSRKVRAAPKARARWGDERSENDSRYGVGIYNGLPRFDWCTVEGVVRITQIDSRGGDELVEMPRFLISRYLVTNMQFDTFLNAPDYAAPEWWDGLGDPTEPRDSRWSYANHPRESVTWYEAVAFTRWVSHHLKEPIRLPTDAEWEAAARGKEGRRYDSGDVFNPTFGNYPQSQIGRTTAVGMFPNGASPFGVYDMGGNLREWTLTSIGRNRKVLRGGSWRGENGVASDLTARAPSGANVRASDIGFRVVNAAAPPNP
ncbi:MAG: SUMF1/EgtB/PvdO family nonheme iron enzyme [bacterium]|nr:SUMF1/EgtB/PvdO family nonheme iron enzyme [bacterium]